MADQANQANQANHTNKGTLTDLARLFLEIERNETNYAVREGLVYKAIALAKELGMEAGCRFDPTSPDWPVFCIDLPHFGEVSWHCPAYSKPYVEYDTLTKYDRCHKLGYVCGLNAEVDEAKKLNF